MNDYPPVVSSTFGELVQQWPPAADLIEPHVWDNMPIWEQRDWLIQMLAGRPGVAFTKAEWTRIALALSTAHLEYLRTAAAHREGNEDYEQRAEQARELCNRICDSQALEDVFRIE